MCNNNNEQSVIFDLYMLWTLCVATHGAGNLLSFIGTIQQSRNQNNVPFHAGQICFCYVKFLFSQCRTMSYLAHSSSWSPFKSFKYFFFFFFSFWISQVEVKEFEINKNIWCNLELIDPIHIRSRKDGHFCVSASEKIPAS